MGHIKIDDNELLDGDYVILDPSQPDVIVFADFGRKGLERASKKISSKKGICAYGVLGSVRGIPILIRNTLAFENVRRIFLIGNEIKPFFSFSGLEIIAKNGIDKQKRIIGFREYVKSNYSMIPLIDEVNIEKKILEWFRQHISVIRLSSFEEYLNYPKEEEIATQERKEVAYNIRELNKKENRSKKTIKTRTYDVMVGSEVYEETIDDAHKLALIKILFSGHETHSQYGKTKEVINLMITVKNPYEEVLSNPVYREYGKDFVNPKVKSDTYTYGRLLCEYNGFNQINAMIERLRKNLEDRAVMASLWMPEKHLTQKSNQPCLSLVHVLLRNNKLNITAYLRSNDIYKAWPLNVAGISYINYHIWKELSKEYEDLKLGYVTTISGSAHIYEVDWTDALKKALSYEKDFVHDKFGYFVINRKGDKYIAKIYENNGNLLGEIEDACPTRLRKNLTRYFSITSEHASYVGEVIESLDNKKNLIDK